MYNPFYSYSKPYHQPYVPNPNYYQEYIQYQHQQQYPHQYHNSYTVSPYAQYTVTPYAVEQKKKNDHYQTTYQLSYQSRK